MKKLKWPQNSNTENIVHSTVFGQPLTASNPTVLGLNNNNNNNNISNKTENKTENNENNNNNINNDNKEIIPPYLMKIFMSDVPLEYKLSSDFNNNFHMHNPYEKLERGSKRNIESLKRRISYNALDFDPSITSRRGSFGAFEDFYENIFGSDQPQIVIPDPVQVYGYLMPYVILFCFTV